MRESTSAPAIISIATHEGTGRKRGAVPKRRYQKGSFQVQNGIAYTLYYEDRERPDGSFESRRVRRLIGKLSEMSERAALREHDHIMQEVNRKRGSVPTPVKGQTFMDAVTAWRKAIAPQLSPATVRQRESYLRTHILPKFKDSAPHALDVQTVQQLATDLGNTVSKKTVINILGTIFAILKYGDKCGMRISKVSFADLSLGTVTKSQRPFFTREQATAIINEAKEPYKTLFSVAWLTGCRAGEILALTKADIDFQRKVISISKSVDDNTRLTRQPKTENSVATLPMPSALESVLRNYLKQHWKPNLKGYLFPSKTGEFPRWRDNVVKYGLKPILKKLGIPAENAGLHAFRHGLATELAERAVPMTVLQKQLRHADVHTTLRVYAHAIPQSQRDAMESIGAGSIGTNVPIGTATAT
jgi:integrase